MSKTLRPWTLSEYVDKQPLIPYIVGLCVAVRNGEGWADAMKFARYTESRMIAVFNRNKSFRRKMLGQSSREWLYAFAEHWFLAWRDKHPRLWPKHDIDELFGKE